MTTIFFELYFSFLHMTRDKYFLCIFFISIFFFKQRSFSEMYVLINLYVFLDAFKDILLLFRYLAERKGAFMCLETIKIKLDTPLYKRQRYTSTAGNVRRHSRNSSNAIHLRQLIAIRSRARNMSRVVLLTLWIWL